MKSLLPDNWLENSVTIPGASLGLQCMDSNGKVFKEHLKSLCFPEGHQ